MIAGPTVPLQDTLYMIGAVVSGTAVTVVFVMREFSRNRGLLYDTQSKIQKLFFKIISQHNKEDDERFDAINRELHRLHIRNAKKDGAPMPEFRSMPQRRYLTEHGGDIDLDALDGTA